MLHMHYITPYVFSNMFNFEDILTHGIIAKSYRICTILEPVVSFTKLLSHEIQKSQFGSKHSLKIAQNHNNIIRNPSPDHCSFKTKFIANQNYTQHA